jgi:hypothetical protein
MFIYMNVNQTLSVLFLRFILEKSIPCTKYRCCDQISMKQSPCCDSYGLSAGEGTSGPLWKLMFRYSVHVNASLATVLEWMDTVHKLVYS